MRYNSVKFFIVMITCFCLCSVALGESKKKSDSSCNTVQCEQHSVIYCLGRGFANIGLGWIEIPHRTIYQGSEVPGFGLASGMVYGTMLTLWRALSGVTDVISLGMGGGNCFFRMGLPDFPWNGPWIAPEPKTDK